MSGSKEGRIKQNRNILCRGIEGKSCLRKEGRKRNEVKKKEKEERKEKMSTCIILFHHCARGLG